jgi:hypothetical protein
MSCLPFIYILRAKEQPKNKALLYDKITKISLLRAGGEGSSQIHKHPSRADLERVLTYP